MSAVSRSVSLAGTAACPDALGTALAAPVALAAAVAWPDALGDAGAQAASRALAVGSERPSATASRTN